MNLPTRFLLFLAALAFPLVCAAAGPVTGLRASFDNGQVHVSWNAAQDPSSVTYYRIYYSQKSILKNAGAYDDFETTSGTRTDFILTKIPRGATQLFLSVLPVGSDGQETGTFTDEVEVDLGGTPALTPSADSMQLLDAAGLSATGVVLTFSLPVTVDLTKTKDVVEIKDASGTTLAIMRMTIDGPRVQLDTAPQTAGTVYTVRIFASVLGTAPSGNVAIDPGHAVLAFAASKDALPASVSTVSAQVADGTVHAQEPAPAGTPDIVHVDLRAFVQDNGLYTVVAAWDIAGNAAGIDALRIRQSSDGGATYGDEQAVAASARFLRFQNVAPGQFGIELKAAGKNGFVSAGTSGSMTLPQIGTTITHTKDLSSSGPGLLFVLVLSGAFAGWFYAFKRRGSMAV